MGTLIEKEYLVCGKCSLRFDRSKESKNCSNCFACTGCEIYYCPRCEEEIIVIPIKKRSTHSDSPDKFVQKK